MSSAGSTDPIHIGTNNSKSNTKHGHDEKDSHPARKSSFFRRSPVERYLIVTVVACVALSIALIVALAVVSSQKDGANTGPQVCTTTECVIAAARIAESLDTTVKPCDDFYTFACGSWTKKKVIPEDRSEINMFGVLRDDVEVIIKNILEENKTLEEVLEKSKQLYRSCMNLEALEELDARPLNTFLDTIGGWPLLKKNPFDSTTFDLTNLTISLGLYNNFHLFSFYVGVDLKNSSARILVLDQPAFGLPGRKYYLVERNDSNILAYETLMRNIAVALGAPNNGTLQEEIKDVVDFEIQLANMSVPDEERRDNEALYNLYTIPQLHQNFSRLFDWARIFNTLFMDTDIDIKLKEDEQVVNRSPLYFTRLIDLLAATDNRTIANYLVWRITNNRATALSERIRKYYLDYQKVVFGTGTDRDRFRNCASYVTDIMGLSVGNLFIKQAFSDEAKELALMMIVELKKAFNELLNDLDWMDGATKVVAREKNEYIDEKIGYPNEVLNITYLTKYYERYNYSNSYFDNILTNVREGFRLNMKQLREPVDRNQWSSAPSTVNAFYNSQRNQILFPAGILQPPFYSSVYPKSLNFGGIGVVIGHEITHGFDDRGRQFDKIGNLQQWWTDEAIMKFKSRAQCIINQYGNYTLPEADMKLNGVNTQGENIADNGGLKQSYRAYRNWVQKERNGVEEDLLPGLQYDNNQLFFINFAQIWCSNLRRESAVNRILTGVHSPGRFRVIGTLQNSEDFAKAFKCSKQSYMNPNSKCNVW